MFLLAIKYTANKYKFKKMNYRHLYHAGNFADVFKHCILVMLLQYLRKKEKGFCFLDTHAGVGIYDLTAKAAQKTREYENGIAKLWKIPTFAREIPAAVKVYLEIIRKLNQQDSDNKLQNTMTKASPFPRLYPGSPCIGLNLLRPQDQMILIELHREDILELKAKIAPDKRVAIHHTDGYQSIKAFLPPKSGRGLVFIDPPFEQTDEFQKIIAALKIAKQRFPTGTYAIWYPIKDIGAVREFQSELREIQFKNIIFSKTMIKKNDLTDGGMASGLTRCGMAIINPPWQMQQELNAMVAWLGTMA